MAYEKQTWKCGDIVSAEKLNHMEDGIAEGGGGGGAEPLILTLTQEAVPCPESPEITANKYTYSHSWQEIYDAMLSGRQVLYMYAEESESGIFVQHIPITQASHEDELYVVIAPTVEVTDMIAPIADARWQAAGYFFLFNDATSKEYMTSCGQE